MLGFIITQKKLKVTGMLRLFVISNKYFSVRYFLKLTKSKKIMKNTPHSNPNLTSLYRIFSLQEKESISGQNLIDNLWFNKKSFTKKKIIQLAD
jgi:hypothetical protein